MKNNRNNFIVIALVIIILGFMLRFTSLQSTQPLEKRYGYPNYSSIVTRDICEHDYDCIAYPPENFPGTIQYHELTKVPIGTTPQIRCDKIDGYCVW